MSKPKMGAVVKFCNHEGTFIADIWEVAGANVVRASGPVTTDNIDRNGRLGPATHLMLDWPDIGYWKPRDGIFVVPKGQVKEL